MKQITSYLCALLLVCSCVEGTDEGLVHLSLNVSGEQPVRTLLDENLHTCWNAGDKAAVFYKSSVSTLWAYYGEDGASSGKLEYRGNPFEASGDKVTAIMPYTETARLEGDVISFTLDSRQEVRGEGGTAAVLVGTTDSDDIVFRYATALIHLSLSGYGQVAGLSLTGNAGEILCGNASVDMSSASPCVSLAGDADGRTVHVEAADGGLLADLNAETADLYVSVPQMTFAEGFTIEIEYSRGGTQTVAYTGPISVEAGKVYTAGCVEAIDEIVLELDFNQGFGKGKSNVSKAAKAMKDVYGVDVPTDANTMAADYFFNLDGKTYKFVFGYCPGTDLTSSKGHYLGGDDNIPPCLVISTNGWYLSLPKIEGHVLRWFSSVSGRDLTVASSTEYFITTDVSSSRGNARNNRVSDRLEAPHAMGEEYVAYVGDGNPSADYYLTQYAGGWLYVQKLRFGYRRIK